VSSPLVIGLDIGTTKISAIVGEVNENGTLDILGVGKAYSRGLRKGVVINIESTVKSIIAAVEAAEMMSGREVGDVYTGLGGSNIEGINSRGVVAVTGKGREIAQEDVDRVIDAAKAIMIPMDREVIHVIPQEFIVDEQGGIKNPIGIIGVRLEAEVHIITASIASAQNIVRCVNRSGFKVNDIILECLAAARATLSTDEKELGTLLIDIGGGTTNILTYIEGAPYYTDVLPIGGEQVTGDISIMLKTPIDSAEKIKLSSGCCYMGLIEGDEELFIPSVGGRQPRRIAKRDLVEIVQPRMSELFTMIKERIDRKGYMKLLGGGVVITGGGSLLAGAQDLASDVFGLPARIGYPMKLGGLVEEMSSPVYATGVGLVLYGADQAEQGDYSRIQKKTTGIKSVFDKMKDWFKEFI
jgi:cell division protein FtsA